MRTGICVPSGRTLSRVFCSFSYWAFLLVLKNSLFFPNVFYGLILFHLYL